MDILCVLVIPQCLIDTNAKHIRKRKDVYVENENTIF